AGKPHAVLPAFATRELDHALADAHHPLGHKTPPSSGRLCRGRAAEAMRESASADGSRGAGVWPSRSPSIKVETSQTETVSRGHFPVRVANLTRNSSIPRQLRRRIAPFGKVHAASLDRYPRPIAAPGRPAGL